MAFTNNPPPGVGTDSNIYHYSIDSKIPPGGQATAANSMPVVLPQSQIDALTAASGNSQEGLATESKQEDQIVLLSGIDDSITLLATAQKQDTQTSQLDSINTNTVPISDIKNNTFALTEKLDIPLSNVSSKITDGNVFLSSLNSKLPVLGQALETVSVPVVLPAAQIAALTPPAAITGFSTETTLSAINTKTPALGQALAANSVPVVLTAAQLTTLTPPAAITGFSTEATLSSLNSKVTAVNTGAVVISSSALPTGAATSAKQDTMQSSLTSIDSKLTSPLTINLPTGASTAANQSTGNASLASIDGKLPSIGQKTSAASLSVVLSSDQPTINVSTLASEVSLFRSAGANATLNIKNTSARLFSVHCRNINAAIRYIQFWNTTGLAGTGTLVTEFNIPASSTLTIDSFFSVRGLIFSSGLSFGFSTTSSTYTAGTAADCILQVVYS